MSHQANDMQHLSDTQLAIIVCTSTTRPANPVTGQHIYETDTKRTLKNTGTPTTPIFSKVTFDGIPYLYNLGAELESFVNGASTGTGSQSKTTDHLSMIVNPNTSNLRTYEYPIMIDLTAYKSIKVDWTSGGLYFGVLAVHTIAGHLDMTSRFDTTVGSNFTRQINTLDVTSLSGNYFVKVVAVGGVGNPGTLDVYKLWLE